ncbi:hypothetical protein WME91_16830 [Sorangium sp. So ce269]
MSRQLSASASADLLYPPQTTPLLDEKSNSHEAGSFFLGTFFDLMNERK